LSSNWTERLSASGFLLVREKRDARYGRSVRAVGIAARAGLVLRIPLAKTADAGHVSLTLPIGTEAAIGAARV
jgi:muramoyltetrapeptide carboxypeptidase LdcA involved in peptidoglycan recycling